VGDLQNSSFVQSIL